MDPLSNPRSFSSSALKVKHLNDINFAHVASFENV
jgi:hypothetical protein